MKTFHNDLLYTLLVAMVIISILMILYPLFKPICSHGESCYHNLKESFSPFTKTTDPEQKKIEQEEQKEDKPYEDNYKLGVPLPNTSLEHSSGITDNIYNFIEDTTPELIKKHPEPKSVFDPDLPNLYRGRAGSCYDCEKQMIATDEEYKGQRSKCFSCEQQYANSIGPMSVTLANSNKCFSCEDQFRQGIPGPFTNKKVANQRKNINKTIRDIRNNKNELIITDN